MGKLSSLRDGIEKASKALDMSYQERMQRAKDMGFDTDTVYYHGTDMDFTEFDTSDKSADFSIPNNLGDNIGAFFSKQKSDAERFGPNVGEYHLALTNPKRFRSQEDFRRFIGENTGLSADIRDKEGWIIEEGKPYYNARAVLEDQGYDGVIIDKPGYDTESDKPWAIAFNNNRIRSINADFDPAKKDSANLLASMGGAAVLGGAALAPEDAEAGVVTKAGKQIIEAYHGSPHDIDKFSMDKVGTGEGAQAYGYGLYSADVRDVAKSYQSQLAPGRIWRNKAGDEFDASVMATNAGRNEEGYAAAMLMQRNTVDDAIADVKAANPSEFVGGAEEQALTLEGLEKIKSAGYEKTQAGNLYKVEIDATPEELLDFDVPLSEQSQAVQNAIMDNQLLGESGIYEMDGGWVFHRPGSWGTAETKEDAIKGLLADVEASEIVPRTREQAEAFRAAGIKGIRYKDGMSRFGEGGTHNYVVFDDQLITIAKKYGISTVLAGSVLAGTMTPEQAQAATGLENFTQRRAAKRDYWKQLKSTMLEGMAGVNRGLVDTLNFVGPDQVNAVLQLSGSENRIPTFSDIPGVQQATQGGYMEPGTARDVVRTGSEFLSPL